MALSHKDRLTAVDASFLAQEGPTSHMHVGAVLIFEGPPPTHDELLAHIRGRLHEVPRFRQKLAFPPLESGRPVWVDDPRFNLSYHLRHTALPDPGNEEQLRKLTGRIMSQQLDRTKPLWEIWLAQGLERNRFALITKTHHALVDGVAGVDLTTVLFDLKPVPEPVEPHQAWAPHPEPSSTELLVDGLRDRLEQPVDLLRSFRHALVHPERAAKKAIEAAEGVGEIVWAGMNPAPEGPLNVDIGPHRRFVWVRSNLADFKLVKNAFGGTVNDVVLTVVAGALAKFMKSRGCSTQGLELRALVPVSIRTEDEHGEGGNRIAVMRGPLPLYAEDPIDRLEVVRQAMDGLKESKQALGAEAITGMNDFMPPTLLAQASRINFSTRLFNLIVTNVPGPQFPLYVLGRELQDVIPVAFLPKDHALAIAIMSYNGKVCFGLLADYDAMGDVETVSRGIEQSLETLVELARERLAEPASEPQPVGSAEPTAAP